MSKNTWLSFGVALVFCCAMPSVQAQEDHLSDAEMRQEMTLAVSQTKLGSGRSQASIRPRKDLEELLATVREKETSPKVYFYQMDSFAQELGTAATSIAAVEHSTGAVNQLYSFEGSGELGAFSDEFSRLVSSLDLSIAKNDVVSLAKLFLESARAGNPGSILADNLGLKLAVQNYYFSMYRDVWKMLDAYSEWYTQFQSIMLEVGPKVVANQNSGYDISLQTLLTVDGKHPQVQDIELTISSTGRVQVRSIRTIFPDQSRWMFFDFPLTKPETWR